MIKKKKKVASLLLVIMLVASLFIFPNVGTVKADNVMDQPQNVKAGEAMKDVRYHTNWSTTGNSVQVQLVDPNTHKAVNASFINSDGTKTKTHSEKEVSDGVFKGNTVTFSDIRVDLPGTYQMRFSRTVIGSIETVGYSVTFTISPADIAKVTLNNNTGIVGNIIAGQKANLQITAYDAFGNYASGSTVNVKLFTNEDQNNSVSSVDLTLDNNGYISYNKVIQTTGNYLFKVSANNLEWKTKVFTVSPGKYDHLKIIQGTPQSVFIKEDFMNDVIVAPEDQYNNILANTDVSLQIYDKKTNTQVNSLEGTKTRNSGYNNITVSGRDIIFKNLSISKNGKYVLKGNVLGNLTDIGAITANTSPVTITYETQPQDTLLGAKTNFQLKVVDKKNNIVENQDVNIKLKSLTGGKDISLGTFESNKKGLINVETIINTAGEYKVVSTSANKKFDSNSFVVREAFITYSTQPKDGVLGDKTSFQLKIVDQNNKIIENQEVQVNVISTTDSKNDVDLGTFTSGVNGLINVETKLSNTDVYYVKTIAGSKSFKSNNFSISPKVLYQLQPANTPLGEKTKFQLKVVDINNTIVPNENVDIKIKATNDSKNDVDLGKFTSDINGLINVETTLVNTDEYTVSSKAGTVTFYSNGFNVAPTSTLSARTLTYYTLKDSSKKGTVNVVGSPDPSWNNTVDNLETVVGNKVTIESQGNKTNGYSFNKWEVKNGDGTDFDISKLQVVDNTVSGNTLKAINLLKGVSTTSTRQMQVSDLQNKTLTVVTPSDSILTVNPQDSKKELIMVASFKAPVAPVPTPDTSSGGNGAGAGNKGLSTSLPKTGGIELIVILGLLSIGSGLLISKTASRKNK